MTELWWTVAMLALAGANLWLRSLWERERAEASALLDEIRRCNEDFEKSLALLRQGAVEEAEDDGTLPRMFTPRPAVAAAH